jgi:hypothetical protein
VKNYSGGGWQVAHQCPQCGAPVILEETDRLFSCPYCKVKLYIASQGYFRFYLSPPASSLKDIIFLPYWRLKGMVFSCEPYEVRERILDATFPALHQTRFPASLGLRPQVLPLRFVSPDTEGSFITHDLSSETAIENIEAQIKAVSGTSQQGSVFHKAFIGETISLIYSPLILQKGALNDAILNRPVAPVPQDEIKGIVSSAQHPDWQVTFVPALCPHCGWDLQGERDSLVLLCRNCDSAWEASQEKLRKLEFGVAANGEDPVTYLPFWRMTVACEGVTLRSRADLARLMNVPVMGKPGWEKEVISFWSPAFKINPVFFLRLAQQVTVFQPKEELKKVPQQSSLYPVTLPVSEAAESLKIILAHIAVPKKKYFPRLAEITIRLKGYRLVYLPFRERGNEFIHAQMNLSINKNTLMFGRNL